MSFFLHRAGIISFLPPPGLTSLTRVDQASAASAGLSMPTGVRQAGDLLLSAKLADRTISAQSITSYTNPSGWTELFSVGVISNQWRLAVSAKVSNGSESGTISGMSTADLHRSMIVVLRPDAPIAAIGASVGDASQATSVAPSDQVVPSGSGNAPLLVFGLYALANGVGGSINPRGMSPAKDDEYSQTAGFYMAWKLYGSDVEPADVTVSMEDESFQLMASFYSQLTLV